MRLDVHDLSTLSLPLVGMPRFGSLVEVSLLVGKEGHAHAPQRNVLVVLEGNLVIFRVIEVDDSLTVLDDHIQGTDLLLEVVVDGWGRVERQRNTDHVLLIVYDVLVQICRHLCPT